MKDGPLTVDDLGVAKLTAVRTKQGNTMVWHITAYRANGSIAGAVSCTGSHRAAMDALEKSLPLPLPSFA